MKGMSCPSCAGSMECRDFARKPAGGVELDLCYDCHAIWFDQYESAQLTPGAVIDLFRRIHEHHGEAQKPLSEKMRCPKCRDPLRLTNDLQLSSRISYYRCVNGHGRFTTFFQFLREKQFIRSLTQPEITQLRAHVKQVRCSSCGAPVSLEKDTACTYCRAPISILDPDAVKRTLAELVQAEKVARHDAPPPRPAVDPDRALQAVLQGQRFQAPADGSRYGVRTRAAVPTLVAEGGLFDLVGEALDFLMSE